MYFILSKVLLYFIYPLSWVSVMLLIAVITKNLKRRRKLLIASIIILYLFSNQLLLNAFSGAWDVKPALAKNRLKPYSCAIVLGGFTSIDKKGNGYFNEAADRFIQGMLLLSTGKTQHLLISGGNGNLLPGSFKESDWTKARLKELKVPDSSILIEDKSRNTIENARYSKLVLDSAHLKPPYLLVTSAFHMRRALMIFKKQGFNVEAYPCNYMDGEGGFNPENLIPDAGALAGWGFYLKEVVGYGVDYFKK